jgi:hypothetical protein
MNRILALQKLEVKEDTQGNFFESIASVACSARSICGCHDVPLLMKVAEEAEKE